jgi:predicted HTH domain antitoxin
MTTVHVPVPDELFSTVRRTPAEVAAEMRLALAIRWYAQGLISQGAGANLAGFSRSAFLDALSAAGVSPFQETIEEIRESEWRG